MPDLEDKIEAPTNIVQYSPEALMERREKLKHFVKYSMREGEDYGTIPGATKPFLFKPGAEAICAAFGLAPKVAVTQRIEDWEGGFVSYEVKVGMFSKNGGVHEGDGIGSCNSRERKYKSKDSADVANTCLKMAKKRAYVDAALTATGASSMFSQDEDYMDAPDKSTGGNAARSQSQYENRPIGGTGGAPPAARNNLRPGVLTIRFGKCKDMTVPELSVEELRWYRERALESISDPAKRNFISSNQTMLDALDERLQEIQADPPAWQPEE